MRSDSQVQIDVADELRCDPLVGSAEIGVSVRRGIATLSGTLESYARKCAAIRAAERVIGVTAVADGLLVLPPDHLNRTDAELARAVLNALLWDVEVPDEKVAARVNEGWVWLDGEVELACEKAAAERAIRYLTGLRGVTNRLYTKSRTFAPEIRRRIEDALTRNAEADAKRISVETADGTVTLRGTVRSWAERSDAERAAWAAPGVTRVNDQLTVQA
ncbi:MAG: BON domain-containing protein [Gemmatimonadaceae bacterium]